MKAPLQIIRKLLLFSILILTLPSVYGAAMCSSSSSTNASGTLTDSGGSSGDYSKNESCDFLIEPTSGNSVTLTFSAFDLKNNSGFLTIYDGSTDSSPVLANRHTNKNSPNSVTSSGGSMLIRFTSDNKKPKSGFVASWTSTIDVLGPALCVSSSSTDASGTLTDSGGSNGNYSNYQDCEFLIKPTGANSVTLIFSAFNLENRYDYLTIYDGATNASPILKNLTGSSLPSSITSTGGAMLVRFRSDYSETRSGFIADWTSTTAGSCEAQSVGDNFLEPFYNQNSGSQEWSGNWVEVGESDGVNFGIARIDDGLCSANNENCLRLGVPSGNNAQTYSNKGVYREVNLNGVSSATLSFVYRRGRNAGSQTVILSVYDGSEWKNLRSYFMNSTNTSPVTDSIDISDYAASNTRIRFLASGTDAVIGMYIDDINISYQPTCTPIPILEYRFDDCSYTEIGDEVNDEIGDFNGTPNGISNSIDNGIVNQLLDLSANNTSDWINVPSNAVNDLDDFSISVWFKTSVTKSQQEIFHALGKNTGDDELEIYLIDNKKVLIKVRDKSQELSSAVKLTDGNWHHLVITRDGKYVCLFINGVKQQCKNGVESGELSVTKSNAVVIGQEQDSFGGSFSTSQNFVGKLDEFKIYNVELSASDIDSIHTYEARGNNYDDSPRDIVQCIVSPEIDHYAITHDGQGLTCLSEGITIIAHDANHDQVAPSNLTTITLSTSIVNDGWTLKSGSGSFNAVTAEYTFSGSENLAVFGLSKTTVTTSPHIDIDVSDGTSTDLEGDTTEDINLAFAQAGFLLNLENHQSCTTPNLTIKAVKLSDSGLECAPAYTDDQSVNFIFNYANPTSGTTVPSLATDVMAAAGSTQNRTIKFDGTGTANLSFNYQDAGQIRIDVSDGASAGLISASVTAVVSPAKLIVASSDTNADCASDYATCSAFKAAGAPFNLDVTASCNNGTVTKNFQMDNISLKVATIAPSAGNPVSLGVKSINMIESDKGSHNESNQTISEVGVFTITATPPVNGYFGETIPAATSANIGRFIPDHFDVSITNNSFEDTCITGTSDFTYIGQPFTYLNAPELLITAKNVSGITTQNYTETGYQKLTSANVVRTFPIADTSKDGTVVGSKMVVSAVTSDGHLTTPTSIPSSNAGEMTYIFDLLDSFTYSKNTNSEVGFFTATYDIVIDSIQDSDGANANTSLAFNVPSTNTVSPTGVNLRFGRWNIDNTFGPETSDLTVPMAIQYWDGSNYVTNTLDNCTTFDGDNVANYSLTLNDLNNPLSAINLTPISGSGNFALGLAELKIGKPIDGSQGQIRLTYDTTPAWLQYDWDWNGVEVKTFDENPSTIATYGLFRGNDRIIYNREVF